MEYFAWALGGLAVFVVLAAAAAFGLWLWIASMKNWN